MYANWILTLKHTVSVLNLINQLLSVISLHLGKTGGGTWECMIYDMIYGTIKDMIYSTIYGIIYGTIKWYNIDTIYGTWYDMW